MDAVGALIILMLIVSVVGGIVLVGTSVRRERPAPPVIPPAQVGGPTRLPRPRIRISVARLFTGLVLLVFGAGFALFILGAAELAHVASH